MSSEWKGFKRNVSNFFDKIGEVAERIGDWFKPDKMKPEVQEDGYNVKGDGQGEEKNRSKHEPKVVDGDKFAQPNNPHGSSEEEGDDVENYDPVIGEGDEEVVSEEVNSSNWRVHQVTVTQTYNEWDGCSDITVVEHRSIGAVEKVDTNWIMNGPGKDIKDLKDNYYNRKK